MSTVVEFPLNEDAATRKSWESLRFFILDFLGERTELDRGLSREEKEALLQSGVHLTFAEYHAIGQALQLLLLETHLLKERVAALEIQLGGAPCA